MHATVREPAPTHSFKRIQLGDVGYIRRGRFHLLFSAGCPLGERRLGVDVPPTFQQLDVGPADNSQPRRPGCLSTSTVREAGADFGASLSSVPYVRSVASVSSGTSDVRPRMLESGISISFELTEKQGAALVTKYPTYREDVELESFCKAYIKRHYDSWVAFACHTGHGDDLKPVLVTGVDMTRDFATMAYSNDGFSLASEFKVSAPMVASVSASVWGTWRTEGVVHTNCGPQLCYPPSSVQTTDLTPSNSGNSDTETVPNEYNQCVFVRYYTIRKRAFVFPTVIKAGVGPHDLGPGDRNGEERPEVEVQSDSDSGSDTRSSLCGGDGDGGRRFTASISSGSDVVIHNMASVRSSLRLPSYSNCSLQDDGDDFDRIADYVFQASLHCDYRKRRGASNSPSLELQR
jgi:hypothetical protein